MKRCRSTMRRRLAKKVFMRRDRYPKHMVKKALVRLFPPGLLRVYMPRIRIIENNSLADVRDISDEAVWSILEDLK